MASNITIPDYIQDTDYSSILTSFLGNVRSDVDKREGSIIWDAGSPCCIEIAKAYVYLQIMILNCFAATAEEPFMDYKAEEVGLERDEATYAYRLGIFKDGEEQPFALSIGTQFSTVNESVLTNFEVNSVYSVDGVTVPGSYILKCTKAGSIGNQYVGAITPVFSINGLASATLTDVLIPGEDRQGTESLRAEYFNRVKTKSFSGNIPQYREFVTKVDGVGACQIYPRRIDDSKIVISIIDSSYNKASEILVDKVATMLDPYYDNEEYAGMGLGQAPMDHYTQVVSCTDKVLNITADVTLKSGVSLEQALPGINQVIDDYLLDCRKKWADSDELNNYALTIFIARVQSAILSAPSVENVTSVLINEEAADVVLVQTKAIQEIPIKGTVTINVV